jgi:hypothetical protein
MRSEELPPKMTPPGPCCADAQGLGLSATPGDDEGGILPVPILQDHEVTWLRFLDCVELTRIGYTDLACAEGSRKADRTKQESLKSWIEGSDHEKALKPSL